MSKFDTSGPRTFRFWGLVETALFVVGFLIMLPILAVIAFFTGGDVPLGGDGGDGGGSSTDRDRFKSRLGQVSRHWRYHHDLELRLVDGEGLTLLEQKERPANEAVGRRLVASTLAFANQHRLVVEERITPDEDPKTASVLTGRFFGGRPLLTPPELREASSVESDLAAGGFSFERSDDKAVLRRTVRPNVVNAWISLVGLILILVLVFFAALPLFLLWAVVMVMIFVVRPIRTVREILHFASELVGIPERHELTLTPNDLRYRRGMLKLQPVTSTEGDPLLAIGFTEGLAWDKNVSYEDIRLRLVSPEKVTELPPAFTAGAGILVHDWVASTMLGLRQDTEAHDFRSQCAFCDSLYDWQEHDSCPGCGGTRLQRRGS